MTGRMWINNNSALVTLTAISVLIVCLLAITNLIQEPTRTGGCGGAWFFDLETGKPFVGSNASLPPIPTPSGHKDKDGQDLGVCAVIFSCGSCADEKQQFIGYLESLTPEAKKQIEVMMTAATQISTAPTPPQPLGEPLMYGRIVADPDKIVWLTMDAPESSKLIAKAMSKCGEGKFPTQCWPH